VTVTVTNTAGGAVALLLHRPCAHRRADDQSADHRLAEAILGLREVVGPRMRELVDRWLAEGGPDGEQVYCLDHLMRVRFGVDPRLQVVVEEIVVTGDAAANALAALGEHCRREGYRGAQAWCQAALRPTVAGSRFPRPRAATAPG
jgi:hypothetical protein